MTDPPFFGGEGATVRYNFGMDDEVWVRCPFCNEKQLLVVDPDTAGSFVQDCDVCCNPWQVYVSRKENGRLKATVERGN